MQSFLKNDLVRIGLKEVREYALTRGASVLSGRAKDERLLKVVRYGAMRAYENRDFETALTLLESIPYSLRDIPLHIRVAQVLELMGKSTDAIDYLRSVIDEVGKKPKLLELFNRLTAQEPEMEEIAEIDFEALNGVLSDSEFNWIRKIRPPWKQREILRTAYNAGVRDRLVSPQIVKLLVLAEFSMHDYGSAYMLAGELPTIATSKELEELSDDEFRTVVAVSGWLSKDLDEFEALSRLPLYRELGISKHFLETDYLRQLERKGLWKESARVIRGLALADSREQAENFRKSSFRWRKGMEFEAAIEDSRRALYVNQNKDTFTLLAGNLELAGEFQRAADVYSVLFYDLSPTKYHAHRAVFCLAKAGRAEESYQLIRDYYDMIDSADELIPDSEDPKRTDSHLKEVILANCPSDTSGLSMAMASYHLSEENYVAAFDFASLALFESYTNFVPALEVMAKSQLRLGNEECALQYFIASAEKVRYHVDSAKYNKLSSYQKVLSRYLEMREFLPIQENVFLFESHLAGRVDCNPLAICKELLEDQGFRGVVLWAVRDATEIPNWLKQDSRVKLVKRQSFLYWLALACANRLVNNVTFPLEFVRRTGQAYLNTWHGTPLKSLGRDIKTGTFEHGNSARNFVQASILIFPNEFTRQVQLDRYDMGSLITARAEVTGYPRNDILANGNTGRAKKVRNQLGISAEEKILLYAPTWRGGQGAEHFDVLKLISDLKQLGESGYRVLFRGHPHSLKFLEGKELPAIVPPLAIDSNDLMLVADVLVTDYSSIGIDFLVTGRPTIWYCYDYQEYADERGLYLTPDEFPGAWVDNIDSLFQLLHTSDLAQINSSNSAKAQFTVAEDGQASSRVLDLLLSDSGIVSKQGTERKSILFRHSFIPNGITSALLGVIANLNQEDWEVTVAFDRSKVMEDPRIADVLDSLPAHVNRVPWGLSKAQDLDFEAAKSQLLSTYKICSEAQLEILRRGWKIEAERIFGNKVFDAVVEYEGYSTVWTGILSAVKCKGKRFFYLHNDMGGELTRRFPWLEASHSLAVRNGFEVVNLNSPLAEKNTRILAKNAGCPLAGTHVQDNLIDLDGVAARAMGDRSIDFENWRDTSRKLVIIVARISIEKNQVFAIEALSRVDETSRPQLAIIGGGPQLLQLKEKAASILEPSDIYFSGDIANPLPYYLAADMLFIPSLHEGQPMVLHEALALGLEATVLPIDGCVDFVKRYGGNILERDLDKVASYLSAFEYGGLINKSTIEDSISNYRKNVVQPTIASFINMVS